MVDFRWQSNGGILIDGTGDIACTSNNTLESEIDIVRSRLKAALNGWKLYRIGADLQERIGQFINPELDVALKRQVFESMTNDGFLKRDRLQAETLSHETTVHILVYVDGNLAGSAQIDLGSNGDSGNR